MPRQICSVERAVWEDHKSIVKLSRMSPFTKTFADVRFVKEYYEKGEILKAVRGNEIVGFACVRHCIKRPYTTIYYLGVALAERGKGIGRMLEERVEEDSKHPTIKIGIEEENTDGILFWESLGFENSGRTTTTKSGKTIIEFNKQKTPAD